MVQARLVALARLSLVAFLFYTAVLLTPSDARANMAAPRPETRPGAEVAEPSGGLKSVHILRETLLIDLRPLREGRPASVEATYRVRNDAGEHAVELVFVAAALAPRGDAGRWVWRQARWVREAGAGNSAEQGVWLDDRPVAAAEGAAKELPKEWAPPPETPGIEGRGEKVLPYKAEGEGAITFRLLLAPGEHTVRVRYEARPSAYCNAYNVINWQLGYVLSPAREWASFGGLDAKVLLPEGWRVASTPAMRRESDALVASWDELPADSLAVTTQTNQRTVYDAGTYWLALIVMGALSAVVAAFAGWKAGRWLGVRRRTSAWALLFSPPAALLLCLLSTLVATVVSAPTAPDQAAFNQVGNYDIIVTFFLLFVSFTLNTLVTLTAAFVARRRTKLN